MFRIQAAILAAAATLLGGCQTTFNAVGVEMPLTALESRHFDGSYQGNISQTALAAPGCPLEHGEKVIMVGDGVLWYAYSPTQFFTAPVAYDGSIAGQSGPATLAGRITGNHLDAQIQSASCQTNLSMNYIYNHS